MEKLDNCSICNRILNQVEYDHQFCNMCGWGLKETDKIKELAFALAYADYLHSDETDMPEERRVKLAEKKHHFYMDRARTVFRRLELKDILLIAA